MSIVLFISHSPGATRLYTDCNKNPIPELLQELRSALENQVTHYS